MTSLRTRIRERKAYSVSLNPTRAIWRDPQYVVIHRYKHDIYEIYFPLLSYAVEMKYSSYTRRPSYRR